ncbi:hypothetical protein [Sinorhizobium fredii]|uniref:hypothetical protein n=1 Tax=Rhizobium fredii TaxID=380 RepID=UPI000560379E|nr:hypothetical protein [Sinorhizobium fredii]
MFADLAAFAAQIWSYLQTEKAANLATALGIPLALYGGWVALQAYRSDKRIAANAHMHNLFQSYLTDVLTDARDAREQITSRETERPEVFIKEQMAGLKLYALEEMFVWIKDQEFLHKLPVLNPLTRRRRQFRTDAFNAWKATIRLHAKLDASMVKFSVKGYTTCYSVEFLEFVAEALGDPEIDRLVQAHRSALDEKRPRPLGTMERLSASDLEHSGRAEAPPGPGARQPSPA